MFRARSALLRTERKFYRRLEAATTISGPSIIEIIGYHKNILREESLFKQIPS
jgi:hypothetical protein